MEVLGAVASAVTLVGVAVDGATFLKGIAEIQDDFKELVEEIGLVDDIVKDARRTVGPISSTAERRISLAIRQLDTISVDLKDIETACSKTTSDKVARAKKRKWIIESNKVAKLLRRAQKAKDNLAQAIQWQVWQQNKHITQQMTVISESMAQFSKSQPELIGFMATISHQLNSSSGPSGGNRRVEELPETLPRYEDEATGVQYRQVGALPLKDPEVVHTHYENNPYLLSPSSEAPSSSISTTSMISDDPNTHVVTFSATGDTSSSTVVIRNDSYMTPDGAIANSDTQMVRYSPARDTSRPPTGALVARHSSCSQDCRCHCHNKPWRLHTPGWMGQLFGDWDVSYLAAGDQGGRPWDSRCSCSKEGALWLDYRPPQWSWAKALFSQPVYTLRCALRPVRVIPLSDSVWNKLEQPAAILRADIERGTVLFPDDQSEEGVELIESILYWNNYDVLELLMKEWAHVLPKSGLSRRAGHSVNWMLSYGRPAGLPDRDTALLEQLGTYVNDGLGVQFAVTALHEAAAYGTGILEALEDGGRDCINDLDNTGLAPLHHATRYGYLESVKQLIDAGADINVGSSDGWTPLMNAAINNKPETVQLLLDAKCRVNKQANSGTTALHQSVYHGCINIVRMLLKHGATASFVDLWGRSVVHYLAFCTQGEVEEAARLIHGVKGVKMNQPDIHGWTPLMFALRYNNLPLIKFYIDIGVDMSVTDVWSLNLIHISARFCNQEVLRYLKDALAVGTKSLVLDTRLRNNLNDTSWDSHIMCVHAKPWELGSFRCPTQAESAAFADLFESLRDKNFQHDIDMMEAAIKALADDNTALAVANLAALGEQMTKCHNEEMVTWYRALCKTIESDSQQVAIDAIKDLLEEMRKELGSSAWTRYCWYNPQTGNDSSDSSQASESDGSDAEGSDNEVEDEKAEATLDEDEEYLGGEPPVVVSHESVTETVVPDIKIDGESPVEGK